MIVYIVPCGGEKLDHPAAARDLYVGAMFRHTLDAAEVLASDVDYPGRVLILSALHGLVGLDEVIAPYDQRIDQPGRIDRCALAASAARQGLTGSDDVFAMVPGAYFEHLNAALQSLDIFAANVYEAAPGIGYQRRVNRITRDSTRT